MLDDVDNKILEILQESGRTQNAALAREVGMAPSAVLERVRKLEARGLIRGYEARLCPRALGLHLLAFVYVKTNEALGVGRTGEALAAIPEVQEVHHVAGEDCYLVKVRAESPEALGRLLRTSFGAIPSVVSTRSTIVLETLKECGRLPLPAGELAYEGTPS
jgi:Lrp/AsnC family leucine-responsive transcriptional regulator